MLTTDRSCIWFMLTIVDRVEPSPGEDSGPSLVSIHFYVARPAAAATAATPATSRCLGGGWGQAGTDAASIVSWLAAWLLLSVLGNPASC